MCLQHTSILLVSCFAAVLHPGLRLQLISHHSCRDCSGKCLYRVWHTSDLGKTTFKWTFTFLLLWEEDCKPSNQSRLHHYWNSYGVYSTISKVEPLPSVLLQIPVTNSTVNGTISGLDFCQCSYFHSCNFLFRSHFSSHWYLLPELWTCWCSATNFQQLTHYRHQRDLFLIMKH